MIRGLVTLKRSHFPYGGERALVSEDGQWVSNGHWLLSTSRVWWGPLRDAVAVVDEPGGKAKKRQSTKDLNTLTARDIRCYLAGICASSHEVVFPSVGGETMAKLMKKPRQDFVSYQDTKLWYGENSKPHFRLYLGPKNEIRAIQRPYVDIIDQFGLFDDSRLGVAKSLWAAPDDEDASRMALVDDPGDPKLLLAPARFHMDFGIVHGSARVTLAMDRKVQATG